jgi:RNA polymerase sigma-70 factor, ECF subfamily
MSRRLRHEEPMSRPPDPGSAERPTDHALLAACASGERDALAELFDRHGDAVHRFLERFTGLASADLDELVNATFLEVHRSARRFRGRAAVKTWIFAVAANVARHCLRSESRRRALLTELERTPPAAPVAPDRTAERRDLLRKLGQALELLPPHLRVVYLMCDVEEIPGVEVARTLGLRDGTLWRRLHDARRALRAALEREGNA